MVGQPSCAFLAPGGDSAKTLAGILDFLCPKPNHNFHSMSNLDAIIIDDQSIAREALQSLLRTECPQVKVIATAHDVDTGIQVLQNYSPDLVFLDVEMGDRNSFEILEQLNDPQFSIIFTSAFDVYAIRAFRVEALDYLQKPVDRNLLKAAVKKAEKEKYGDSVPVNIQSLSVPFDSGRRKLRLPTQQGFQLADINSIVRCEAQGNYTTVYFEDQSKFVASKPLKEFEAILRWNRFFRCHQSHLINLSYIKEYQKGRGGQIFMQDGSVIDLARSRKQEFLKLFEA